MRGVKETTYAEWEMDAAFAFGFCFALLLATDRRWYAVLAQFVFFLLLFWGFRVARRRVRAWMLRRSAERSEAQ